MSEKQQFEEAIQCSAAFLKNYRGNDCKNLSLLFLRSLTELSQQYLEGGVDINEIKFTPAEIYEQMQTYEGVKALEKDDQPNWIRNHYRDLVSKRLPSFEGNLKSVALTNAWTAFPGVDVDSTPGGRGKKSAYFIKPIVLTDDNAEVEKEAFSYQVPEEGLRYQEEQSVLPFYATWLRNYDLVGWRRWLWVAVILPPMILVIVIGVMFFLILLADIWVPGLATFIVYGALYVYLIGMLFHPFYRVLNNRIVKMPNWMSSITSADEVLLELRVFKRQNNTVKHRGLRLVTYVGICPVCSGRVTIHGGGFSYWGRLIGKCEESPREHVYTFDHITRVGLPLRSTIKKV